MVARFVGDFRAADRERAEGIADRMELIPYAPHRQALELQRDSDALLLLIPDASGRGRGVLSGKVFEYLAAGRPILAVVPPDGAAAELIRETGAGVVVAPDDIDGMERELRALRDRWNAGTLEPIELSPEWRREGRPSDARAGARRPGRQPRGGAGGMRRRLDGIPTMSPVCHASHARSEAPAVRRPGGWCGMRRATSFFFLATLFCCTFEKVHWSFGGQLALSDLLALVHRTFITISRPRLPRTSAILLAFGLVFVVVYLLGFYNLNSAAGLTQFAKGFAKFVIHFTFLALAVAWLPAAARAITGAR